MLRLRYLALEWLSARRLTCKVTKASLHEISYLSSHNFVCMQPTISAVHDLSLAFSQYIKPLYFRISAVIIKTTM